MYTLISKGLALAVTGALALVLSTPLRSAPAETANSHGYEKCYGISLARQDDGSAEIAEPGISTADYQGNAFKFVAKGTCEQTVTPFGFGSLTPVGNRPQLQNRP